MPPAADLLLQNARIYTADPQRPTASAVAIRDGHVLMAGPSDMVRAACPGVPSVDARGHTIVPGFIDAHAHLHELGHALRRADLSGSRSPDAVVERLERFVETHDLPPEAWLRGHGWDDTEWPSLRPTRHQLDDAFPERPVWLTRTDLHAGWANTAAIEATVGLDRLRHADAPSGGRIHRGPDGTPTGLLIDQAMAMVADRMPSPPDAEHERALRTAADHAVQHGITGLHDAGLTLSKLRRITRLVENKSLPLRLYAMVEGRSDAFDYFQDRGPLRHPSGRLRVEAVKFFADGALGSRGAALLDDYADEPGHRGLLLHEPDSFRRDVQAAVAAGLQVCTHAIGDRANRVVLDAYEAAMAECDASVRRPRIEHAQILSPADRSRFGELGVLASVQPTHATSDHAWVESRLGPHRLDGAYAWKSLQDVGTSLAFGSDAPVEPIDPLRGLHAAVTRQDEDGHPEGGWQPSERLSRQEALHAYTRGAAYAAFMDEAVGSITPGKRADMAVLSEDPMTGPPRALLDIEVAATYLNGRLVHSGPTWPDP